MQDSDRGTILDSEGPDIMRTSLLNSQSFPPIAMGDHATKKILVLGLTGTGKSNLVIKFLYDFSDIEGIGNEESHLTRFKYKKEDYMLNIIDVASMDNYTPLLPTKYCLKVDGYVFVYSVENEASFQFIQVLRNRLYNLSGKMIPSILVANKCEISSRVVTTDMGSKFAKGLGVPYIEIDAKKNSKEVITKVFEEILKEILKSEAEVNTLKWLKNWDKSRVDDLRKIFFFALILTGFIGIFFIAYSVINMSLYPSLMALQGAVLIFLIIEGFVLLIVSVVGWIGMQKEKEDYIAAFSIIIILSTALDIALIALKAVQPVPSVDKLKNDNPQAGAEYNILDPIIFIIITMALITMVFLFIIARLSKEIFLKRRNANKCRFATLRA